MGHPVRRRRRRSDGGPRTDAMLPHVVDPVRARRRLGEVSRSETDDDRVPDAEPAPPLRPVEDVVIIFGRVEVDRLRHALQGPSVTGRATEHARRIEMRSRLLDLAGSPGRPRAAPPAGVSTPESGRSTSMARSVRRASPSATPAGPGGSPHDLDRLPPVRDPVRAGARVILPPLRPALRPATERDRGAAVCPVCYRTVDDDGRLPSLDRPGPGGPRRARRRARPTPRRRRRLARDPADRRPDPDRPLDRAVRHRPALPRDRPDRRRPEPRPRPRRDRHRHDPAQPLGPGRRHLRRHARLEGGAGRRHGADGAIRDRRT